jgi:hypothetical protein
LGFEIPDDDDDPPPSPVVAPLVVAAGRSSPGPDASPASPTFDVEGTRVRDSFEDESPGGLVLQRASSSGNSSVGSASSNPTPGRAAGKEKTGGLRAMWQQRDNRPPPRDAGAMLEFAKDMVVLETLKNSGGSCTFGRLAEVAAEEYCDALETACHALRKERRVEYAGSLLVSPADDDVVVSLPGSGLALSPEPEPAPPPSPELEPEPEIDPVEQLRRWLSGRGMRASLAADLAAAFRKRGDHSSESAWIATLEDMSEDEIEEFVESSLNTYATPVRLLRESLSVSPSFPGVFFRKTKNTI